MSIGAAALPIGVLVLDGIVSSVASIPGPVLVAAMFGGPLLACGAGVTYGVMRGAARDACALAVHALGLIAFVVGVSWGFAAASQPGADQDAAIFSPDILLVGLSFLCAVVGAVALWLRDDSAPGAARRAEANTLR